MKYKRQLVSSMLALTMMVGVNTSFAADVTATATKTHQVKNQLKMKDNTNEKVKMTSTEKKGHKKAKKVT